MRIPFRTRRTWQHAIQQAHGQRERAALRLMFATGALSRSPIVLAAQVKHRQRFA